jgi:hypothetical protein
MITFRSHKYSRRNCMNLETLQIQAFVTIILALTSLIVIPVTAMAMSKLPVTVLAKSSGSLDGTACDLPPTVQIEGKTAESTDGQQPPMDKRATGNIKTATFAMG